MRLQQRPHGSPLSDLEQEALAPFFEATLLETVRVTQVPSIPNPDFYALLLEQSLTIPLDFTGMAAITLVDTILLSARHAVPVTERMPLLFHECVHVVQYAQLGVDDFLWQYVRGWAAHGFHYSAIPLERWAYELDARFRSGAAAFSVAAEVRRQLGG